MLTSEVLTKARAIVANPATWTQGTLARDKDGNWVNFDDPNAVCFCAAGAIGKASGAVVKDDGDWDSDDYQRANTALGKACFKLAGISSFVHINDGNSKLDDHRELEPHAAILVVFDHAIETAKFVETHGV